MQMVADFTTPKVLWGTPTDNANGVAVGALIEAKLSEPFIESTLTTANFSLLNALNQPVSGPPFQSKIQH